MHAGPTPLRVARPAHLPDNLVNVGALGPPPLEVLVVPAAQLIIGGMALGHHAELAHRVFVKQLRREVGAREEEARRL